MTVVLAWTTTPEGLAAQETAVAEARRPRTHHRAGSGT